MPSFNQQIIDEFRTNDGHVGGPFANDTLLLLTTTGQRSGQPRTTPLAYSTDGDAYLVAASNGGSDANPAWLGNLSAHPTVTIEVGTRTLLARAEIPAGTERDRLWDAHKAAYPAFAKYETLTDRAIPVVLLRPEPAR